MKNECTTRNDGDFALVVVTGEVDLSWSQQIRRQILDALAKASMVGVDLSQVSYIDSSGIAALVEGFQNARGKGQKFSLIAASASVRGVLELARLDRVFPMVETIEAARG